MPARRIRPSVRCAECQNTGAVIWTTRPPGDSEPRKLYTSKDVLALGQTVVCDRCAATPLARRMKPDDMELSELARDAADVLTGFMTDAEVLPNERNLWTELSTVNTAHKPPAISLVYPATGSSNRSAAVDIIASGNIARSLLAAEAPMQGSELRTAKLTMAERSLPTAAAAADGATGVTGAPVSDVSVSPLDDQYDSDATIPI